MSQTSTTPVRITHIGGPTVLIEIDQLRILTDPTFEPAEYQYVAGPQIIRKTASPALSASAIAPVDAILLSHDQHGDNLDPAGRTFLSQARQVLTTPAGAQRLGGAVLGVPTWETINLTAANGLTVHVTSTPASHGPSEIQHATGDVTGWLLEWDGQQHGALYISGDTVLFPGLEEVARRYRIAVALLHCGAARAERFGPVDITFTGEEAALFTKMLGTATIIPIHYEGWSHFTEGRAQIEQAFAAAGIEQQLRFLPFGQIVPLGV